jgi:hypothetical protein
VGTIAEARPRGVGIAVAVLCVMAILGAISGAWNLGHSHIEQSLVRKFPFMQAVQYLEVAGNLILNLFFAYMIFRRYNWARIIVLVFYILGLVFALPTYLGAFDVSAQVKVFGAIAFVADLVALILLYTGERSLWFKQSRA